MMGTELRIYAIPGISWGNMLAYEFLHYHVSRASSNDMSSITDNRRGIFFRYTHVKA